MIQQGHAYRYAGSKVIALETTDDPYVVVIEVRHDGWPGEKWVAMRQDLTPLPMRYFHGQLPK